MDYSFPRYLLSKQTVDDRALNKDVVNALRVNLPSEPVSVIEIGAGIGTMLKRLIEWNVLCAAEYVMVDEMAGNIAYARAWVPQWAKEAGLSVERMECDQLRICDQNRDIRIRFECADVFDFIEKNKKPADLLIAHAFLDLLPMPVSLEKILSLTNGLAWLTINFDGMSSFQPVMDRVLDEKIEWLYHESMNTRSTGGDSRTGRKLFEHLRSVKARILAAGASDWVVYADDGKYPADENYFLHFVLHFFESSLKERSELEKAELAGWLATRHEQIECGELVYIAHQMDFLVKP
ncbi:MAG: class I SAM-dependent methyltransferase [Chloroflexota bacterium]